MPGTAGNAFTGRASSSSVGNGNSREDVEQESVTDPTPDGSGNFTITVGSVRVLNSADDVLGFRYTGTDVRLSVDSVSGNTVTFLAEEPDGAGAFQNRTAQMSGTVTVTVVG